MAEDEASDDARRDPEIVRDKWNSTFRSHVEAPPRRFSWQSRTVQDFMRRHYQNGHTVSGYLKDHLKGRRVRRGLEVGGGLGAQARLFHQLLGTERFDILDISTFAVEKGNARARAEGLNLHYAVSDLNEDELPENTYDLIIASGALHHIANLEHLFEQIAAALTPVGVFFANDYMGPNHMQWTDRQLALMNAIVAALPDEMNVVSHRQNQIVREITRIPLDIFARVDPSEGVRAKEIFEVLPRFLDIVEVVPLGQTLAYEALRGRIQNFDDEDPKDRAILTLICLLEKSLIECGEIESDFNLVIARRKDAA